MRPEPRIDRSLTLQFIGDWGQANFHRICGFMAQEFCDRAGPRSRVATWNIRGGGAEALPLVHDGEAHLCIATPAMLLGAALDGLDMFDGSPMPGLRALAVLPQDDRLVMAVDAGFGISTFAELRASRPPLRIAVSADDGTNFIGHVTARYMAAHGIEEATLRSWGGRYVGTTRPEQSLSLMERGEVDAVVQEAVMTPWWAAVIEARGAIPLPAEEEALEVLRRERGYGRNDLPAGYWKGLDRTLPALDFSDFAIIVREDLPDDVAHLLTWCLVERRGVLERGYRHLPPDRSPLAYPLDPARMASPPLPLHAGARRFYEEAGIL